jgi:hypothetical protein
VRGRRTIGRVRFLRPALILAVLAVLACGCRKAPPAPTQGDAQAPVEKVEKKEAAAKLVDLLRFSPAVVAVSSKVDNPKDFPEHIVDGKSETAWNGKTGDLRGWIAFRVPADARVKRIELTVGFDRDGLFEKNVRIAQVRIKRNDTFVMWADLDPKKRGMQTIALDEPGGDFVVEVTKTEAGSRADYQELCVSELAVLGLAPRERYEAPHLPDVKIGGLDVKPSPPPPPKKPRPPEAAPVGVGPFATPEDYCVAQKSGVARAMFDHWGSGNEYPGVIEPSCATSPVNVKKRAVKPPFLDAREVYYHEVGTEDVGVLLETDRGWWKTPWILSSRSHNDPGCMHSSMQERLELTSPDPTAPVVWMRILDGESSWMIGPDSASWTTWTERLEVCRVDATTKDVVCEKTMELAKDRTEDGGPMSLEVKPTFEKRKTPKIGDGGTIELVP